MDNQQIKSLHLQHRLIQRLNNEKVELSYTLLAGYLLNHYVELENLSIDKVCEENFISISTLRRFCQSLGYENFSDLKESKHNKERQYHTLSINIKNDISDIIDSLVISSDDIQAIINLMKSHNLVFVLFPSTVYSAAYSFQQQLIANNKYVYLVPNIDNIFPYITKGLDNSLVIILDCNKEYTDEALSYLNDIKCKKIVISNYLVNSIACDKQVFIPSVSDILLEKYVYSFYLDEVFINYLKNIERFMNDK